MNKEVKNFTDLQAACLNLGRAIPTKTMTSLGPDNNKMWVCEIVIADFEDVQRSVSARSSKKELSEQVAVLKAAKILEEKPKPTSPRISRGFEQSVLDRLDAILSIIDPKSIVISHLQRSGDVESNPGPSDDERDIPMKATPLPKDFEALVDFTFHVKSLLSDVLSSGILTCHHLAKMKGQFRELVDDFDYYEDCFYWPAPELKLLQKVSGNLSTIESCIGLHSDYLADKLKLSGDVEENPGPKQDWTPKEQRQRKSKGLGKVKEELNTIKQDVKVVKQHEKREQRKENRVFKKLPSESFRRTRGLVQSQVAQTSSRRTSVELYKQVVKAVSIPSLNSNLRWPSQYSLEQTGTSNVFERPDVGFAKGGTLHVNDPFPTTECFGVLQKIPECGAILFDHNTSGSAFAYQFTAKCGEASSSITYGESGQWYLQPQTQVPLRLIMGRATLQYKPHTNTMYAARHPDKPDLRFIWMNKTDKFSFTIENNTASPQTFAFTTWKAGADGVPVFDTPASSGVIPAADPYTYEFTAQEDGYYAWTAEATASFSAPLSNIHLNGNAYCFGHRHIPSFDTNIGKISSSRVLGASIMMTENSSVTNMQGKIIGCQIPKDKNWYDYVNSFDEFSGLKESKKFDAITGIYGFIKPTSGADFEMSTYHTTDTTTVTDSFWPIKLDKNSATERMIIYPQVTNTNGQDFYWTLGYALEYRSNDQFVALGVSRLSMDAVNRALEVIKHMEQFYENPLHLSDIVKNMRAGLNGMVNGAKKYIPKGIDFVNTYGPMAIRGAEMLGSLL